MVIVDEKTYEKTIKKLRNIIGSLTNVQLGQESVLSTDSHVIFTASMPFGNLFKGENVSQVERVLKDIGEKQN